MGRPLPARPHRRLGSSRSAPFRLTIDRVAPTAADRPDLLSASDTGRSTVDQITRTMQPAFRGVGEPNTKVRVYANRIGGEIEVVGQGITNADGSWEITVEPLDDDIYHIRPEFEDMAGNISSIGEPLLIEVDTEPPNTPYLDLLRSSDTGRASADNVTRLDSVALSMTTQDPRQDSHWVRFNYNYRIYLRPDAADGQASSTEVLLYDSLVDDGIAPENRADGLTDLEQLTRTIGPLPDGVHQFKLEVEDRSGNISDDYLLNVTIDTTPPPAELQLLASSDSGMFSDDAVTNLPQPAFGGTTEVGAAIRLFANDRLVGWGQAGSDASDGQPDDGLGVWEITAEPLRDGEYEVVAEIEDLAGNLARSVSIVLNVDTTPPNLPYLDLLTDNGISDTDNITDTRLPVFTITANDTLDGGPNPFPHEVTYRLYDRSGTGEEVLLVDSFIDLGGFTDAGFFSILSPELSDDVHNLKLEVEDRAGNVSPPFTLQVQVSTQLPTISSVELAEYSDSGMNSADNVTKIAQPAIVGLGSVGDAVLITANGELVGKGTVNGDATDGIPNNGIGRWEITLEPLDDGVYHVVATIEDVAGNRADSEQLTIEIDTHAPNTPLLDLIEADDHGRHNDDQITNAQQLRFSATSHDSQSEDHLVLFPNGQNFKYRLYSRPEEGAEQLLYDSASDVGLVDLLDGLTAASQIQTPALSLAEGWFDLKLEVEDRAGNVSEDYLLDLLVDRSAYAGQAFLSADGDSGISGVPSSFSDRLTRDRSPWLTGTAEANALVTATIDGVPVGTAIAIPGDGDDAVQPPATPYVLQGNWRMQTVIAIADGVHQVLLTYEDPAGNQATSVLELVVDTSGPKIVNVTRNDAALSSVFDPKPAGGPDPLMQSLVVHFVDLSPSTGASAGQIAESILSEEGNYQLVGDATGSVAISRTDFDTSQTADGQVTSRVTLFFNEPLPDDRFTLTVSDALSDLAGNQLDGESGGRAPFEGGPGLDAIAPVFPSGDGVPGGAFVARFTVDSRPELGTSAAGNAWIDINGNFRFDPENADLVNRDIVFRYGFTSDDLVAGNFALPGQTTDGYDKLAAYGRAEGQFRWLVDTDNDGVPNIDRVEPQAANGLPVAGRFDANNANGDEVGVFDGSFWYFDTNHDFRTDTRLPSRLVGYPVVGDFDGDGFDDLATWADNRFMIDLAPEAFEAGMVLRIKFSRSE